MSPKIKTINYSDLVNALLTKLPAREKEIIEKRNSLADFPKHTLEQIGNDFNITRERVRQIERDGLKRIKNLDFEKHQIPLNELEAVILDYLKSHGGVMAENHLKEKLLREEIEREEKALSFILNNILGSRLKRVNDYKEYHVIWALPGNDLETAIELAQVLKSIIEENDKPYHLEDLLSEFQNHEKYQHIEENEADQTAILEALLRLNKDIHYNILGHYGLNHWNQIKPKRMTDKAYLIMLREGRPLHFAEVADLINLAEFDRKKAHPATVHNELILDDKYVLVGRGIYALKEWGYKKGTVADIIIDILKAQGPLTKKQITEEVLKQRLVQKTTITLVLMNKEKFAKTDQGLYQLVV